MTTQAASLELEPRETLGKKVKALRRTGIVPVHLYGRGVESRALQCEVRTLLRAISQAGGEYGQPMRVSVAGESGEYTAETSEIQWNPRTGDVLHVDFRIVSS
jgi:large subunit ribosomal protein L25